MIETALIEILRAILFAFLGGLILNLMPCVLPILSLKALSLSKSAAKGAAATRLDGVAYALGVVLSFVAIAGVMLSLRSMFGAIGWGFQLQNPIVVLTLAILMAAIGFNLIGVFDIGTSVQGVGQSLTKENNPLSSFFTGVLAVIVAAPCTAPFMASALGAALIQPAPVAIAIFAALGLGLAFPYLVLSFAPATRSWLPKPGAWTAVFKQVLAFPMFGTAIWLLWILGGQTGKDGMAVGLVAIALLGLAVWAFGKHGAAWKFAAAITLVMTVGTVSFIGRVTPPVAAANSTLAATSTVRVEEIPYSPQSLDELLNANKAVFAYFTADWCLTCKVNERVAIKQPVTEAFFEENDITVMVGDWTSQNPDITAILTQYDRAGVPMYLYFASGAKPDQGVLLPQILTPAILKNAILKATGNPS